VNLDETTMLGLGLGIAFVLLFLARRGSGGKDSGWQDTGWGTPRKKVKKKGPIQVRFKNESAGKSGSAYKTGNKKYDENVDFYSNPGTYELKRKEKKGK
jgi:hypothetical protein